MKINFEGREWSFEEDDITFRQGELIWKYYQITIEDFIGGIDHMDQRCYHVAYWLMRQQAGEKSIGLANCADVRLVPFMAAVTEARMAEANDAAEAAAAQEAPDPEPPVPTSPPPGDQAWSGQGFQTDTSQQQSGQHPYQPQHTGYSPSP